MQLRGQVPQFTVEKIETAAQEEAKAAPAPVASTDQSLTTETSTTDADLQGLTRKISVRIPDSLYFPDSKYGRGMDFVRNGIFGT